jgi:hypothetical protein
MLWVAAFVGLASQKVSCRCGLGDLAELAAANKPA